MVMKEQDDDLKNWMRGACRDAPLSENFTNQVMDLIALLPEPEILPLISTRIWRVLLFVMAGIFALVALASIDLKTPIELPVNTPDLNALILDNWMAFGGLLMTTLLIIADEIWRRKRSKKEVIV
jgi:hypothetical protein